MAEILARTNQHSTLFAEQRKNLYIIDEMNWIELKFILLEIYVHENKRHTEYKHSIPCTNTHLIRNVAIKGFSLFSLCRCYCCCCCCRSLYIFFLSFFSLRLSFLHSCIRSLVIFALARYFASAAAAAAAQHIQVILLLFLYLLRFLLFVCWCCFYYSRLIEDPDTQQNTELRNTDKQTNKPTK